MSKSAWGSIALLLALTMPGCAKTAPETSVDLPVKTPREIEIERMLDQKIPRAYLPGVPLLDCIENIRNWMRKNNYYVDFMLDPDPKINEALLSLQPNMDVQNVTLRELLNVMLKFPRSPYDYVTSIGIIYISTPERCREWAAHTHDHDHDTDVKIPRTPKELDLEARLDMVIPRAYLPGLPLLDCLENIKNWIGKDVDFRLDPDPKINADLLALQSNLDLHGVTLRTLLCMMLQPQKPPFDFVISRDTIYISDAAGCRAEAAAALKMYKELPNAIPVPEPPAMLRGAADADMSASKDTAMTIKKEPSGAGPASETSLTLRSATDGDLAALSGKEQLRQLILAGSRVTDAGLLELKEMKNLNWLDIGWTRVTDSGLANLKELKSLRTLDLSGTQVTDAGLAHLKELKGLKYLNLRETRLTDAALAALKAALPDTDISQ